MAQQPMIPLQQGGNLSALSFALNDDDEADKDKETEALAEALDMDVEEISDEIIAEGVAVPYNGTR